MGDTGHFRLDLSLKTAALSPEFSRAVGQEGQDGSIPLDNFFNVFHGSDRSMARRKIEAAGQTGKTFRFEARVMRKEGEVAYMLVAGVVTEAARQQNALIVGAARDVSTEMNAHLMLQNLEHVQHALNVGMYSYDVQNGELIFSRDIWVQLGIAAEMGDDSLENAFGAFSKTDRRALLGYIDEAIASGAPFEFRSDVALDNGGAHPVVVTGLCRMRLDGTVSHVYGSVRLDSPSERTAH